MNKYRVERRAFTDARNRCTNPDCEDFPHYGGRGIKFLFTSFEEFFAVLGKRPAKRRLDRIDNDGHYEPRNVRWATTKQSCRNQRHPHGHHALVKRWTSRCLSGFTTEELLAELAKRE